MANFLTRAVMGLFLSKKAQKILERRAKAKPMTAREQALAQVRAQSESLVTQDRAELIRHAMAVRKAKQTVLADLSDIDKQKLVALAMRKLLNEDKPK